MKKQLSILLYLPILLSVPSLFAQDEQAPRINNLRLGIEFGAGTNSCGTERPDRVRELYSQDERYYIHDQSWLTSAYLGIKPEFFIFNNRLGIASGLRFTEATSKLSPQQERSIWSSNRNYLLWRMAEDGLTTHLVQLRDVTQKSYLLGIPLEIRIFPNNRELPFQHYFKMGASFNFRVASEYQINFRNAVVGERYHNVVRSQMPDPNIFSAFFYGGIGFKIGRTREGRWVPWGNIELLFPYLPLTSNAFAFTSNDMYFPGIGFQSLVQIPIGKNAPMGSKNK